MSRCWAFRAGQKKAAVTEPYNVFLTAYTIGRHGRWALVKSQLDAMPGTWIMVGDEVVVTKSGKETFGLGKFFLSIQNQVVGGLCFINISLIHVESRRSFPLMMEQLVRSETQNSAPKAPAQAKSPTGKPGRPKGSKNNSRTEVTLSAFRPGSTQGNSFLLQPWPAFKNRLAIKPSKSGGSGNFPWVYIQAPSFHSVAAPLGQHGCKHLAIGALAGNGLCFQGSRLRGR